METLVKDPTIAVVLKTKIKDVLTQAKTKTSDLTLKNKLSSIIAAD